MTRPSLEDRVARLERLVAQIMAKLTAIPPEKNWQRSVGMFKGDPIMKEIIEEGE